MGPTCEVLMELDDDATLDSIDAILAAICPRIERTRKGRVWDVWIEDRPFHLSVHNNPPTVVLAAGCNDTEDYVLLRSLSGRIAAVLGGLASEPSK